MLQAKFSITEQQSAFLDQYREYGFKDKSEVVRTALEHFRQAFHDEEMRRSAILCAEVYESDLEAQAWVKDAMERWPE
ncbi:MAG: hypothetical protein WC314_04840 [Vulcanimicrobiota bacterium]